MTAKKVWGTIIIVFGIVFVIYGVREFYLVYSQSLLIENMIEMMGGVKNQVADEKMEKEFMIAYILKAMIILFGILLSLIGTKLLSSKT